MKAQTLQVTPDTPSVDVEAVPPSPSGRLLVSLSVGRSVVAAAGA